MFMLYSFHFFVLDGIGLDGLSSLFQLQALLTLSKSSWEFSLKTFFFKNIKFYASNHIPQMNLLLKFKTISFFESGRRFSCFFFNTLDCETELIVDIHDLLK